MSLSESTPLDRQSDHGFHDAEQGPLGLRGQRWPLPAHGHLHTRLLCRGPKNPIRDPNGRKAGDEKFAVPEVPPARFV